MSAFEIKRYEKDLSFDPIYNTVNKSFYFKSRFLPGMFLALGFLVLGTQVIYPLFYFKTHEEVSDPIASKSILGLAAGFSAFEFKELENSQGTNQQDAPVEQKHFYLGVPKLGIKDALVDINSPTLIPDKALGHYKGSGLPGEVGNAFIYGHSVLPWFYNPKNYKTIFSTLGNLTTGDTITITYNNKNYEYKVETVETLPTNQVFPLAEFKPKYLNESTITLMTCWPAGTKAKRLLVKAVMI